MALSDPANGGIAGHLAQSLEGLGQEKGSGPCSCCGIGRFGAGMATTDDEDVVGSRVSEAHGFT